MTSAAVRNTKSATTLRESWIVNVYRGGRKKKLKASVAKTAASTPGPLSQSHATRKTATRRSSACAASVNPGISLRSATATATKTTAAPNPTAADDFRLRLPVDTFAMIFEPLPGARLTGFEGPGRDGRERA